MTSTITIPMTQFVFLIVLLGASLAGWGWTLNRSFKRAMISYDMGDKDGYRRGCLAYLKAMAPKAKPKKRK